MKAANLATRPLRRSPSAQRAYVRLAVQIAYALNPELRLLHQLRIGAYVASHINPIVWGNANVGAWEMPAGHGWAQVANCVSGGSPSHMLAQAALLSASQEANINSCIGNQAATGAVPLAGAVPSGYRGVWFLEYTHDASPGNPRYAARKGYERANGPASAASRQLEPLVLPKPFARPGYTKLVDLVTMVKPGGRPADKSITVKPGGSVKIEDGQVRKRPPKGTREKKVKPWSRVIAMFLSRRTEDLSEFYEFSVNAAEALDYKGPDTMKARIKWLYWDGHIDDLSFGETQMLIRENEVEDMMYGAWQRSFKQATKPNFPRNPEVGNALDGWQL